MQELLGRIANLDPQASLGLRVITCFDELMVGEVNSRALAAAAAAPARLPGRVSQRRQEQTARASIRQGARAPVPAPPR